MKANEKTKQMINTTIKGIEAAEKKRLKEKDMHVANLLSHEKLTVLQTYLHHNYRLRNVYLWLYRDFEEVNHQLANRWKWDNTTICHLGITYQFKIVCTPLGHRLRALRYVYRDGIKTNARVLRTLIEKHYRAVEYLALNPDIHLSGAFGKTIPSFSTEQDVAISAAGTFLSSVKAAEDSKVTRRMQVPASLLTLYYKNYFNSCGINTWNYIQDSVNSLHNIEMAGKTTDIGRETSGRRSYKRMHKSSNRNPVHGRRFKFARRTSYHKMLKRLNIHNYIYSIVFKEPVMVRNEAQLNYSNRILQMNEKMLRKKNERMDRKENGVFYTPSKLSKYLATQMTEARKMKEGTIRILDPSAGGGQLLLDLLSRAQYSGYYSEMDIHVTAFEIDGEALKKTQQMLSNRFKEVTFSFYQEDFVDAYLSGKLKGCKFDYIIENAPYVRNKSMGEEKSKFLAKKFHLNGRADLSHYFTKISAELLSEDGVCGMILSNKVMSTGSARNLREYLLLNTSIEKIVDFGDTKQFDASVLPCMMVFKLGKTDPEKVRTASIYENHEEVISAYFCDIYEALARKLKGPCCVGENFYDIKHGSLSVHPESGAWAILDEEEKKLLEIIRKNTHQTFCDVANIRIGVKTGADSVFIMKEWAGEEEDKPELLRPLIGSESGGKYLGSSDKHKWVVYPHVTKDSKTVPAALAEYPNTKRYLESHRESLEGRACLKNSSMGWHEIQVHQEEAAWSKTKIVFRDILDDPQFWIDNSGAVVNGNCFWLQLKEEVPEDMLYLILGVANSSFITEYYDATVNNKIYSGRRRFDKQSVMHFPLPDLSAPEAKEIVDHVKKFVIEGTPVDQEGINALVHSVFSSPLGKKPLPESSSSKDSFSFIDNWPKTSGF